MKLVKSNKNKKGFTLIELIVVIAIIAILALILIPTISGYIGRAEESRDKANARNLYTAAILVVETEEATTKDDVESKVKKYGNFEEGTYSVTLTDGEVTSVVYNDVTFDGAEFGKATE